MPPFVVVYNGEPRAVVAEFPFLGVPNRALASLPRRAYAEGTSPPPPPLFVGDADTQIRWYLRLKKEYMTSVAEGRAFVNPLKAQTLRWRS